MGGPWHWLKRAKELWSWYSFVAGVTALVVTLGAAVIAWISTTWDWYWHSFSWAGVAFVFLAAWLVFALGIFLIGTGVARWRGGKAIVDSKTPVEPGAPVAAPITPPAKKIFIEVTPKYLMNLYDGRTTYKGDVLAAAYVGKWISVKCKILDVSTIFDTTLVQARDDDNQLISASFNGNNGEPVQHLPHSAKIEMAGEISSVSTLRLALKNCEIVTGVAHVATSLNHS
jgi:hypothetical protein